MTFHGLFNSTDMKENDWTLLLRGFLSLFVLSSSIDAPYLLHLEFSLIKCATLYSNLNILQKITICLYFPPVCDPVMGDDGVMYVPQELLPVYRDTIVPLADIVTPNQFEVELLTGKSIKSEQEAWDAVEWFHDKGVKTVAISSSELGGSNDLLALVSHKEGMYLALLLFIIT